MSCMEAIFKSLLQKQGYNHICLLDPDKQIWGYEKDGVYHFCKEDLTEVDRAELKLTDEIAVLSITDEKTESVTKDFAYFRSAIILDKQNRILANISKSFSFFFRRINTNSIVVTRGPYHGAGKRKEEFGWQSFYPSDDEDNTIEFFDDIENFKDRSICVIIDGNEFCADLYLCYDNCYFFITENDLIVYHPQKGMIYKDSYRKAVLWKKKFIVNTGEQLTRDNTNETIVRVVSLDNYIEWEYNISKLTRKWDINDPEDISFDDAQSSNDFLMLPFNISDRVCYLLIHSDGNTISAKCFDLCCMQWCNNLKFQNGIIIYDKCYYDLEGNILWIEKENRKYFVYWKQVKESDRYEKSYGVLRKEDCKHILKPIYSHINFYGDDTFEVELSNYVNGENQSLKGLYHAEKGFLLPFGIEYHHPEYWNNITGISINTAEAYWFNIFSFGEHEGLLLGSEKVLEPIYDYIEGFPFWEKFNEDEDSWYFDREEAERKTKEYQPLSVILHKDGKRGLFIDKEHIIEPIFDRIECCKVLKGYAYFKAQQEGKKRIISDDVLFNEKYQELYDNIVIEDYGVIVYFNVYKDGKIGMISTDTNYSIPIQYEELQVFSKCYIGDGFFYTRNGQKLFSKEDYELDAEQEYLVFKNVHSADYAFVTLSGEILKSNIINKTLISVICNEDYELAKYNTLDKCFIKEEENNWIPYDDYPTDYDIKMGLMEAYNGDPEALWNND